MKSNEKAKAAKRPAMMSVVMVGVNLIDETEQDAYRQADDGLVESVRKDGILQNLIVRQAGKRFKIVAGRRRLDAARRAGLESVPAVIMKNAGDAEAITLTYVENYQRETPHPVLEADMLYEMLLALGTKDPEEIAARVGKSGSYVRRRLKLRDVKEGVRTLLGDLLWTAPVCNLELLGTLTEEDQIAAVGAGRVTGPVGAFRRSVRDTSLPLNPSSMMFGMDDAFKTESGIVSKTCRKCPYRTATARDLFEDEAGEGDLCLCPDCYRSKLYASVRDRSMEHGTTLIVYAVEHRLRMTEAGNKLKENGFEVRWVIPSFKSKTPSRELLDGLRDGESLIGCQKKTKGARPAVFVDFAEREITPVWVTARSNFPMPEPEEDEDGGDAAADVGSADGSDEGNGLQEDPQKAAEFAALCEQVKGLGIGDLAVILAWTGVADMEEVAQDINLADFGELAARSAISAAVIAALENYRDEADVGGQGLLDQVAQFCAAHPF